MILSPGQEIAGRYEIIDKIGSGGMANVYKALDRKLNRPVTFKVMREEYVTDEDFLKRFDVEARAAASLSNQHIVNVYDVGFEEDIHYIVMEYVDGVTLKQLIKKRAPFDNDEMLGVAIQIATALEHAHKNGIVHRDIKPQNILVTRGGISKVTDFGIARASTTTTITTTSNSMGSVHYFSPEQARGGFVDLKSDIYSLGIVMYEMATGQLPFDGDSPVAIALKHINDPLPDPAAINPALSDKLLAIMRKATAKLSADRYQDITEMGNDLKRALTNSTDDLNRPLGESSTLKLTAEEIEQINKESTMSQASTKVPRPRRPAPRPEQDEQAELWQLGPNKRTARRARLDAGTDELDEDDGVFSDKKVVIAAVLTSFILIVLISALLYIVFWKPHAAEADTPVPVTVPSFSGWSMEEATTMAESLQLVIKVSGEEPSDTVEAGKIISQDYGGEAEIYEGGTLWVVLSKGAEKYKVPDVVGLTPEEAYVIFKNDADHFTTSEVWNSNEDVPIGIIYEHDPPADTMAPPDTLITLYVSLGPAQRTVNVPDLRGKTEAEAITTLQEAKLAAPRAVYSPSETVSEGKVIRQAITPDTEVPVGTPVEFTISSGPPPAPTPSASPAAGSSASSGNGGAPASGNPPSGSTVTKTLPVYLASIPEGADSVHVLVLLSTVSGNSEVFNGRVNVSDLPIQVSVSGTGHAELIVFTVENGVNRTQGSTAIDFSEVEAE